jgi:SAM-dependent methyltransferase
VSRRWRDHQDRPVDAPEVPGPDEPAFYQVIGDFQRGLYRRNAFARGTPHEVAALRRRLGLAPGDLVLDVGCGDARHLRLLAAAGVRGVGVDVSAGLLAAGRDAARRDGVAGGLRFVRGDARRLPVGDAAVDAALCLCHGGFGTSPETDAQVVAGLARAVRPGGRVAFTAFHALFAARHLVPGDAFDPARLLHHQVAEVVGPDAERRRFDLWTATYTAREARAVATTAGLEVVEVVGCEPGRYDGDGVGLDDPELLVVATGR